MSNKLNELKKLNKKQKIKLAIIIIIVILIVIALLTVTVNQIRKIIQNTKKEEIKEISYKIYSLNEDFDEAQTVIIIQNEKQIKQINYISNENKELSIYPKNKNKVAIDYKMKDLTTYNFKVIFEDSTSKDYEIDFEIPRIQGNYNLNNGVYVNEPDVTTGLAKDKTRYMYLDEYKNLIPGNWLSGEKPENWYNYANKEWANIYSENEGIGSYYVWIPRYCYKQDLENSTSGNERMDIKFINVYNEYIDPVTNEKTSWKDLKADGYQIPEAFMWGSENAEYTSGIEIFEVKVNSNKTVAKVTYAINGVVEAEETDISIGHIFENVGEGNQVINVTALDENGEIIGSYTSTIVLKEPERPDTSAFDQDTTFYVWWDENGNEHNETPLRNEAPEKWYKYSRGNWANIVSRNNGEETYYVWIPRYEYKLNTLRQRSEIRFIGTDITNENCTSSYQVPEAFWWDNNNNGVEDEGEQLLGYWITKYQLQEASNYNRIDANMLAGSQLIRIKEITGSIINTAKTNGTELKYEYYLNGKRMEDAIGESAEENYVYKNLQENTTYTINIILRNKITDEYLGAVTKKITTITLREPNIDSFNKEVTYYVTWDSEGNEQRTPLTQDPPTNWYDYSNNNWANIVTTNEGTETYFTWIPRYEYKLDGSVNPQKSIINFIGPDVTNGNGKCTPGYQVPEAFWWDNNNNGIEDEGEQLTGYWITKYQLK